MPDIPLPAGLHALRRLDARLAEELESSFLRLARAGEALTWAQQRLPALLDAPTTTARLELLVREGRALTGAPEAWAVTWRGDPEQALSVEALAGDGVQLPSPDGVSKTIVGHVAREQRPAWSHDALADARYHDARSVQAYSLRSVGCLPLGRRGVLYLHDPTGPGRFPLECRAKLTALCVLASSLLDAPSGQGAAEAPTVPGLVGEHPSMVALAQGIAAFAPLPWAVLVLGETGVGKEVVARALHALSPRAEGPFVAINAGAIPEELAESTLFGHERGAFTGAERRHEGLVARAAGGTLFLDEVGELSPRLQVKLLRLLQEGVYERVGGRAPERLEARVVAATHRPLDTDREGFRDDLYYRLAACVLHVPPLRERRSDVPALARHLLDRALDELPGVSLALSEEALVHLAGRPWPGNVRELENVLRGAIGRALGVRSPLVLVRHLAPSGGPAVIPDDLDLHAATEAFQKQRVAAALAAAQGNRSEAARALGVSRQWLYRLLGKWGMS